MSDADNLIRRLREIAEFSDHDPNVKDLCLDAAIALWDLQHRVYSLQEAVKERSALQPAEIELNSALCQFCNEASDDYEPVDQWRESTEHAFKDLCKAYNEWYSWHKKHNRDLFSDLPT